MPIFCRGHAGGDPASRSSALPSTIAGATANPTAPTRYGSSSNLEHTQRIAVC